MHETRVVREMVAKVQAVAVDNGAVQVELVRFEIGAMSHVTPDVLASQFAVYAYGSMAENAELDIVRSENRESSDAFEVRLVSVVIGDSSCA
ncbi:MAG: hydrogenase/urease maturation nickel metallochaperone HypA [Acidimicrobiia bacterium]